MQGDSAAIVSSAKEKATPKQAPPDPIVYFVPFVMLIIVASYLLITSQRKTTT